MNAIAKSLARTWLRHHVDPTSWISTVVALATACNVDPNATPVQWVAVILGALTSIVLWVMDGRPAAARVVRDAAAAPGVSPVAGSGGRDVLAGNRPAARAGSDIPNPPGFDDNGAN